MTELASTIEEAYRARASEFLRVATAIAGSREGGRDAVQEALARAFSRRGTFRGSGRWRPGSGRRS
jgi:DNA-directed RNA polymerase specialized sigma24 family protein